MAGTIVVAGTDGMYGHWGSGDTLDEAKRRARREGALLGLGYEILTFPEKTEFKGVDEMGRYYWNGEPPETKTIKPRKALKRPGR